VSIVRDKYDREKFEAWQAWQKQIADQIQPAYYCVEQLKRIDG